VDIPSLAAQRKQSLELCAREERYRILQETAGRQAKIATAHTLSDSLETVLLNFVRGTALKGLCGIPPVRGNVIRPLIDCTRTEIEEYCRENGLSYVTDSTNLQPEYTRNQLRLEVIPRLAQLNGSLEATFARFLQSVREDEACLSDLSEELFHQAVKEDEIDLKKVNKAHRSLRHRMIRRLLEREGARIDNRKILLM
jgi:tRNA(Ile)-lysidine synthase